MIDEPRIAQLEATPTAVIPLRISRADMPKVMGPAIQEVIAAVEEQGARPIGAVFAHHFRMDPEVFDFEVGVPVSKPVLPAGRVRPGERPATRVVQTLYHGPYEGLPEAWGAFHRWIEEKKLKWAPDIWEVYVVHPDTEPNPANWRTELNRPLAL